MNLEYVKEELKMFQKEMAKYVPIPIIPNPPLFFNTMLPQMPPDIMPDTPKVQSFRKYAEQITETYKRKNRDYGDSFGTSVRKYGLISALTRMSDKFNRAENLILNREMKQHVTDEALEDTLLDLAAYCIMTVMELPKSDTNDAQ